jgi:hypothetical protein
MLKESALENAQNTLASIIYPRQGKWEKRGLRTGQNILGG